MAVKWTKEQRQVIDLRDRNILVSAAAGSGKTAVLVERIISMITDEKNPVDVDKLLVVTYTEAAAAEMKERIAAAIEKKLEESPGNLNLEQQASLIHSAMITTVHKFCLSVIRDHFHVIGIDPSFRVGEEGELRLLKQDVLDEMLEEHYAKDEEEFREFVEKYGTGRTDKKIEELILQLYEYSRSYPDPRQWLISCAEDYEIDREHLEDSRMVHTVEERVRQQLGDLYGLVRQAMEICQLPAGQGYNFHKLFLTKLSCYWSKDTSSPWCFVIFDDDSCILIKFDVRTIFTTNTFYSTYNNGLNYIAFFNNAAWCCIFDGSNDNITDIGISSSRTAHNTDTQNLFCTCVISNSKSTFLLNHAGIPPIRIN